MEKLELKHIAPYLPYGLKFQTGIHQIDYGKRHILTMNGLSIDSDGAMNIEFLYDGDLLFSNRMKAVKPILRPLSDLTKEIEHGGKRFVPAHEWDLIPFRGHSGWANDLTVDGDTTSWEITGIINYSEQFFKYHFDVFRLIPKGLAVDINTVNT